MTSNHRATSARFTSLYVKDILLSSTVFKSITWLPPFTTSDAKSLLSVPLKNPNASIWIVNGKPVFFVTVVCHHRLSLFITYTQYVRYCTVVVTDSAEAVYGTHIRNKDGRCIADYSEAFAGGFDASQ